MTAPENLANQVETLQRPRSARPWEATFRDGSPAPAGRRLFILRPQWCEAALVSGRPLRQRQQARRQRLRWLKNLANQVKTLPRPQGAETLEIKAKIAAPLPRGPAAPKTLQTK